MKEFVNYQKCFQILPLILMIRCNNVILQPVHGHPGDIRLTRFLLSNVTDKLVQTSEWIDPKEVKWNLLKETQNPSGWLGAWHTRFGTGLQDRLTCMAVWAWSWQQWSSEWREEEPNLIQWFIMTEANALHCELQEFTFLFQRSVLFHTF